MRPLPHNRHYEVTGAYGFSKRRGTSALSKDREWKKGGRLRFGRLVALSPTKERDRKGSVYWQCICDCGKEAKVTENGLVHGNNRSCGCLKRENQKRVVDQLHMVDGTCLEWLEKRKSRSDNTSGFRGIYCLKNGRYRVGIGFKRERYYLGTYDSMEEAVKVRLEAEKNIHGEFVKQYRRWKERADADAAWGKAHPLTFRVKKGAGGTYRVVTEMGEEGTEVE